MQQAQKGSKFMRLKSKEGQKPPGEGCLGKQMTGQ